MIAKIADCLSYLLASGYRRSVAYLPGFGFLCLSLCLVNAFTLAHSNGAGHPSAALGAGQHQASYLTHGSRAATQRPALCPRGICPFRCPGRATAPAVPFVLFPSGSKAPQGGEQGSRGCCKSWQGGCAWSSGTTANNHTGKTLTLHGIRMFSMLVLTIHLWHADTGHEHWQC